MTGNNQLRRSGIRLRKHGALWFEQTRKAGETFIAESSLAGATFAEGLRSAGTKLVRSAGHSAQGLQSGVRKEILDWRELVLQRREAYVKALQERLESVELRALDARKALKPGMMETTVLESASELLGRAQSLLDERLQQASMAMVKPPAAKTASKRKAGKKDPIPLRNYDQLTARDLVNKVQRLSAPQASAVLDYERARKKRATVIRAVEQRLAAAS
jgi:hypothetical protein